jgi:EAL domain-containing protein (putative c-di-GMP-specific phosphodiesterase class I)
MSEIAPYHDLLQELGAQMAERGSLGLILVDVSGLQAIEEEYGSDAYAEVRQRVLRILSEQRGKDYRASDIVAVDEPGGLRFVFFLDKKRRKSVPVSVADLKAARNRFPTAILPSLGRAAFPYLKTAPRIDLGYGVAVHNSLITPKRIIDRALRDAAESAALERRADELQTLEKLQDLLVRERVVTAYQAIMRMPDRSVMAYEALSRGAKGSGLESAGALFGAAEDHGYLVELDRLCRSRALLSSSRIPATARIFVNTLPTTIRDPFFKGKPLIDFLDKASVAPNRIVIEITEKLVIENYNLFRETMAYFTDLGMNFAVDDVGAGYSGLEAIARLKPAFLKIDMALVRDVHVSQVNREMCKAIISLGHGTGAAVIAEGIQTEDEFAALLEMDVDYGQGFLLARPEAGPDPGPAS